jgi:ElaB/YqjD/DUF883 family membrane-anchored ribosome-binding protein
MPDFQTHPEPAADEIRNQREGFGRSAERAGEYIANKARTATEETGRLAGEVAAAARQRPFTTIAIAAGLAFAVGALWKIRTNRQSNMDALLARLPELPSRGSLWPRAWR